MRRSKLTSDKIIFASRCGNRIFITDDFWREWTFRECTPEYWVENINDERYSIQEMKELTKEFEIEFDY